MARPGILRGSSEPDDCAEAKCPARDGRCAQCPGGLAGYGRGAPQIAKAQAPPDRWLAARARERRRSSREDGSGAYTPLVRRSQAILGASLALVLGAGIVAALPRIANDLPRPLQAVAHLPERLGARFFPRRAPKKARRADLTDPERQAAAALAPRLDGLIAWASNRSGHHELYLLDLRARAVRRVTNHPAVSFFPRVSPDGRQLVFLRSQRAWVSGRDPTAWDVYVIRADGTDERRVATSGYHPTWTADGRGVIFHRGTRVYRYDLATQRESLVFDAATVLPGIEDDLGDVELAPDGRRLAFVLRGRFAGVHGLHGEVSGAAVFDLETRGLTLLTREQACQTTWAPDGRHVMWMETGGSGGTRVMIGGVDGTDRRVFMDLPGAYSHEYFPKVSNDGRWLIWGAAAQGHEQDQADYEIFVWEIGTPWEHATRLTFHPGNDNWPDLWVRPRG
jgi:WD40-like Beta Propeller Repeat